MMDKLNNYRRKSVIYVIPGSGHVYERLIENQLSTGSPAGTDRTSIEVKGGSGVRHGIEKSKMRVLQHFSVIAHW